MGLDYDYNSPSACPVGDCPNLIDYVVHVQWSIFDFLDDGSCLEHLAFTVRYWMARTVDGQVPVITVDFVWP